MGRLLDGLIGPVTTVTVTPSKSTTADEVMARMDTFSTLVIDCKVELVDSTVSQPELGTVGTLTLQGRERRIKKFETLFNILQSQGKV